MTQVTKWRNLRKRWFDALGENFEKACGSTKLLCICLHHFEVLQNGNRPSSAIPKPLPFRNYDLGTKVKYNRGPKKGVDGNPTKPDEANAAAMIDRSIEEFIQAQRIPQNVIPENIGEGDDFGIPPPPPPIVVDAPLPPIVIDQGPQLKFGVDRLLG